MSSIFFAKLSCSSAHSKSCLSRDVSTVRGYINRYVVCHVVLRDINILRKYESMGRVAQHIGVAYSTELPLILLSAPVS